MTEIIFINRITTDCMSFHDAIYDNKSLDGGSRTFHSVSEVLAYIKLGGDFLLIISPDDFPGNMEPLMTYIMNNNIPFIFRYTEAFIKDNKLGDIRHIIDSVADKDAATLVICYLLDNIAKNKPVVLSIETAKSIQIIKTTFNSIDMCDKYDDWRMEYKSDIAHLYHDGDWTTCYFDDNKERKNKKTIDEMVDELEDEGIIKVHASYAICKDKAVNMYYDGEYKILMPNNRIASVSRKFKSVIPIIRKILEDKRVIVNLRKGR
jgi:hypothetical protein